MTDRFTLGRLVITASAARVLATTDALTLVRMHLDRNWGEVCDEDKQANEHALNTGARLLSAYTVNENRFYVITDACLCDCNDHRLHRCERPLTTVMRCEDY